MRRKSMNHRSNKFYFVSLIILIVMFQSCIKQELSYTDMVNPFVGTAAHGHTFPGATLPFGMIQLSPDTRLDGWDGCSGYHYSDDTLYGFSHTALSGTGVSDYGDLLIMPFAGDPCFHNGAQPNAPCSYASPFKKSRESAHPGYYSVYLEKPQVFAELTSSLRSGMHRYSFTKASKAGFVLDLAHRDQVISSSIHILNDSTITGHRVSNAWAKEQHFYFAIRLSKPFTRYQTNQSATTDSPLPAMLQEDSAGLVGWFGFDVEEGEHVVISVGISAVDTDGALRNLDQEIKDLSFDALRARADSVWNRELGKIEVSGGKLKDRRTFYTALYHTMIAPNLWSDVDGRYRGMDLQIHTTDTASPQYTVFSLWDTYRTLHPLLTIIDQKRTNQFIRTFLRQHAHGGRLPVWELAANETDCMIGYHSVSVITDAYMKGIRDYDTTLALQAMVHTARLDHFGQKAYREHGYIPADLESESVSKTLEYAYDDWCIAMMAKSMGKDSIYQEFIRRSQYYKNLFDPETRFFRPKTNSTFITPFDPREVNFHLTEANTWQYNFYVPHDLSGHVGLIGGDSLYNVLLDEMFSSDSEMSGRVQSDITGLIGQYAHGNEPSHHMAYLYAYTGEQYKTAGLVRRIMREMYTDQPDGLCGNEDCGQMSAWYVMSAMGFYPVCPGSNQYVIGSPLFSEIKIHLENGKEFLIRARGNRQGSRYIKRAMMNDEPFERCYITHEEIMAGGHLRFMMSSRAVKSFGAAKAQRPTSKVTEHLITPVPYIVQGNEVFFKEQHIRFGHPFSDATVIWQSDPPMDGNPLTGKGILLSNNLQVSMYAEMSGWPPSHPATASFLKIPENRSIRLNTDYAPQYSAGGDHALIDFLRGGNDFRTGRWQGYHQVDLDAVVRLEAETMIRKISIGFLQDENSWIFMPLEVTFQISTDGKRFTTVGVEKSKIEPTQKGTILHNFSTPALRQKAYYVRVIAKNRGVCPTWHLGAGDKAWIFADEIVIE
jgi:predicted alpha-1,2-mannosidase